MYGDEFLHYDYNAPLDIASTYGSIASVLIVDPPFLSEECMHKTLQTVDYLSKEGAKIIISTGKGWRQNSLNGV
jgi:hypothetical protein